MLDSTSNCLAGFAPFNEAPLDKLSIHQFTCIHPDPILSLSPFISKLINWRYKNHRWDAEKHRRVWFRWSRANTSTSSGKSDSCRDDGLLWLHHIYSFERLFSDQCDASLKVSWWRFKVSDGRCKVGCYSLFRYKKHPAMSPVDLILSLEFKTYLI